MKIFSLSNAIAACGAMAVIAVALAFPGAERASSFMSRPGVVVAVGGLALWIFVSAVFSLRRHRLDSAFLHAGCACILAGWVIGRAEGIFPAPERPVAGSMALIDGDSSDTLWSGPYLTNFVGRVPFTVHLEKFFVKRYSGPESPVQEYRSHVQIHEPGKAPYPLDIRVNHPGRVAGYWIYQMSWGESTDRAGNPVVYTVLQFLRDPGIPVVWGGFILLLSGLFIFSVRVFRNR